MSYQDALEDCLARIRSGYDLESVLARYPREAAQLREDLDLSLALGQARPSLPVRPGAEEKAWTGLQAGLRELRSAGKASPSLPRRLLGLLLAPFAVLGGGSSLFARGVFAAAAIAAVAVIALGASTATGGPDLAQPVRSLVGSSTAEAASFDGVVVDNANGVLTVQTPAGIEAVTVPASATIADVGGARVMLPDLAAGQVVTIKGKRLGNGTVAALSIDRQTLAALKDWCAAHSDQCQQLKDRLESLTGQCRLQNRPACQALESRLGDLRDRLSVIRAQIEDLTNRCRLGAAVACRELKRFCQQHKDLCQVANDKAPPPKATPAVHN
jgi:hypothetical protein